MHSMVQQSRGQQRRLSVIEIVMANPKVSARSIEGNPNQDRPDSPTTATARILLVFGDEVDRGSREAIVLHVLESLKPLADWFPLALEEGI